MANQSTPTSTGSKEAPRLGVDMRREFSRDEAYVIAGSLVYLLEQGISQRIGEIPGFLPSPNDPSVLFRIDRDSFVFHDSSGIAWEVARRSWEQGGVEINLTEQKEGRVINVLHNPGMTYGSLRFHHDTKKTAGGFMISAAIVNCPEAETKIKATLAEAFEKPSQTTE